MDDKLGMLDPIKLKSTLDFVQGFILHVTVIYEEVLRDGRNVFVRLYWRNGLINIAVRETGKDFDIPLSTEAGKMARSYLEESQ